MKDIAIPEKDIATLNVYLKGKGFDLSEKQTFEESVAEHVWIERDGLFSLREHSKPESLDFLYIDDVSETKFYPLMIKEMLANCKVGGFLIFKIDETKSLLTFKEFCDEVRVLVQDKAALRKEDRKEQILVLQKTKQSLIPQDSVDRWTFGIISDGKKIEQIDQQIAAIRKLRIPEYEIIICGVYKQTYDTDIKYIYFNDFGRGWITRKKNVILENAKYENVVVMHDRILLSENFYEGMKKFGNNFELLCCKTVFNEDTEKRCGDWITYGTNFWKAPHMGLLDYRDWDKHWWVDGGFYILKKSTWRRAQWDEFLLWSQGEDIKLSEDWKKQGVVVRFNQFSSARSLSWRHGNFSMYVFNPHKLGERKYPHMKEFYDSGEYYAKQGAKKILRKFGVYPWKKTP